MMSLTNNIVITDLFDQVYIDRVLSSRHMAWYGVS